MMADFMVGEVVFRMRKKCETNAWCSELEEGGARVYLFVFKANRVGVCVVRSLTFNLNLERGE
jgi:hypothetical protein